MENKLTTSINSGSSDAAIAAQQPAEAQEPVADAPGMDEDYEDEAMRLARKVGLLNEANAFTGVIGMNFRLMRLIAAAREESSRWPVASPPTTRSTDKRDAERYRWLRSHCWINKDELCYGVGYVQTEPELLDEPIDAAIAAIQRETK